MKEIYRYMAFTLLTLFIGACGDGDTNKSSYGDVMSSSSSHELRANKRVLAYYGDKENNRVVVVDINSMELVDEIATGHQKTYAAEIVKTRESHGNLYPKLYVDNRGSNAIDVIDSKTDTIIKTISLKFHPRSISVNKKSGLVLVSGVDKPMSSVIDSKSDEVIATVGLDTITYPTTSGHSYISSGTLACGHPEWLNENHFVLIDREHKFIDTYKIFKDINGEWKTTLINRLSTPSPVHNLIPPEIHGKKGHIVQGKHGSSHEPIYSTIFYATAEGASGVYPSILKLEFTEEKGLSLVDELEIKKEGLSADIMGVHHLNFLKNQKYIYVGSDEGNLFIVNYDVEPMVIEKIIPAGKGAGHTAELEHGDSIAVVINHKDSFITLVDTLNNEKIADIKVSNISPDLVGKVQTQSHPKYYFSRDGRYFYLFLTQEGALVKVDLSKREVVDRLDIGGKLSMGSFIGH
jgi:YVTN family beta-propeller protein